MKGRLWDKILLFSMNLCLVVNVNPCESSTIQISPQQALEKVENSAALNNLKKFADQSGRHETRVGMVIEGLGGDAAEGGISQVRKNSDDLTPRIVIGIETAKFPSVGALLRVNEANVVLSRCSGTLIGPSTFLTAAHCFKYSRTPKEFEVFFQHAGIFKVSSVDIHPNYKWPNPQGDLAIVRLHRSVSGINPSEINYQFEGVSKRIGRKGIIVGFGRTGGDRDDFGIKRVGQVITTSCRVAGDLICWDFKTLDNQLGEYSNTCDGDSGGPFFVYLGGRTILAGVTSQGDRDTCVASVSEWDHAWEVDVYKFKDWILAKSRGENASRDSLQEVEDYSRCDPYQEIEESSVCELSLEDEQKYVTVKYKNGELNNNKTQSVLEFPVPPGLRLLRFSFNAINDLENFHNFIFYINKGKSVSASDFKYAHQSSKQYGFYEVPDPPAQPWSMLIQRVRGAGKYQVVVTMFKYYP